MLYYYLKKPIPILSFSNKKPASAISVLIILSGFSLLFFTLLPLITWYLYYYPKIKNLQDHATNLVIAPKENSSYFSNFIPSRETENDFNLLQFSLSVPKLNIKDAKVVVNSLNFKQNLAHFPGSALPGESGNSFITGHSVLPQFSNPKDYNSIFSRLSDLEINDSVFVSTPNHTYHYQVINLKIVKPNDLSVLLPPAKNNKYLTLMTCVPPGLTTNRLIVQSKLVEENFE